MNKLISILLFVFITSSSTAAFAIDVRCKVGDVGGLTKTAYTVIETEWEYLVPGYFYAMMISIDADNNIRGQWAAGGHKSAFRSAGVTMWISRVDREGAFRKIHASGGLSPVSGDICQSKYTQILY